MNKRYYTPYQEWLAIRYLVKENNKEIRLKAYATNHCDNESIRDAYRFIAEYYFHNDNNAFEIYKDKCENNWMNDLSAHDLFRLYNYQNKILEKENFYIGNFESICFFVNRDEMKFFDDKIDFTGKPPKTEDDKKQIKINYDEILTDLVEDTYQKFLEKSIKNTDLQKDFRSTDIFDKKIGFNLGVFQEKVMDIYETRRYFEDLKAKATFENDKLENEKRTMKAKSEKDYNDLTPCFPEFEYLFNEK